MAEPRHPSCGVARPVILAVPNVAEGRDFARLGNLVSLLEAGPARLLDWSSDLDHNRAVFTLAGQGTSAARAVTSLAGALAGGAGISEWKGIHPTVGILDVAPFVWLEPKVEAEARTAALETADELAGIGIPTFLYGALATDPDRSERAAFRRDGFEGLARRMATGELTPDFGPSVPHPVMGVSLVTARPPLVAFNVELEGGGPEVATKIAAALRESGGGPKGLRAIGLELSTGRSQVSMNVGNPTEGSLGRVVSEVARLARAEGAEALEAELVGLAPEAALVDYPDRVPIRDFDPGHQVIERRLASIGDDRGGQS